MSFDNFLNELRKKASELKNEVLKFKNKTFLDAAMASAAYIAMANGECLAQERQRTIKVIEGHEALSVFSTLETITAFKYYVELLEKDFEIGEMKVLEAIHKLKGNEPAGRTLVRLAVAVGGSDGQFDAHEKRAARKVAVEVSLNPAEFEL